MLIPIEVWFWKINGKYVITCHLLDKTIKANTKTQAIKALGNALKMVKKETIEKELAGIDWQPEKEAVK